MSDVNNFNLLRLLENNPNLSQREAAEALGISLGKLNYVMNALIEKGLIKIQNFKNSKNKLSYTYLLTTKGIEEKVKMTFEYYEIKKKEFEDLQQEIKRLEFQNNNLKSSSNESRII